MRDITIFWRSDGSLWCVAWKNREMPTEEEKNPPWATFVMYTLHTHDFVDAIQKMTQEKVSETLHGFFRGSCILKK